MNNSYDYLEVYDGLKGKLGPWNKTATLCRRSQRGLVYFSSGGAAKLHFVTDGSYTRYGFRLQAKAGITDILFIPGGKNKNLLFDQYTI